MSVRPLGEKVLHGRFHHSVKQDPPTLFWFTVFFFFQAEDGIRDLTVTGVQTCALPISCQMSKRARYLTGAFIVALLMAFTALFFGSQARQTAVTAQNERRIATARELALASINNLDVDPERSLLLALQSAATTREVDGTILPESVEALHHSIVASPIRETLRGHGTRVLSAAFSPDGKHLATIGDDGTTIVWDSLTGDELLRLPGTTKPVDLVTEQRIAYTPDGKRLAVCDSNQLKIYDPRSGELIMALSGHER